MTEPPKTPEWIQREIAERKTDRRVMRALFCLTLLWTASLVAAVTYLLLEIWR